jgi:hypothetical protein
MMLIFFSSQLYCGRDCLPLFRKLTLAQGEHKDFSHTRWAYSRDGFPFWNVDGVFLRARYRNS